MSHTDFIRRSMAVGPLAVIMAIAVPAAASTLVVRSNGPSASSYPAGKTLDPGGTIILKTGDTVTVLDAGGTRVLRGPGKVAVTGNNGTTASGLTALLASNGARQSRTGATRGASNVPQRPTNLWQIDASRGGVVCVANPATLAVWRPSNDKPGTITVARITDGKAATIDYRLGQSVQTWPVAELPVVEGGRYRLEGSALAAPTTVTLHLVAGTPSTLDGAAETLLAGRCNTQVDLLVQSTMDPGAG